MKDLSLHILDLAENSISAGATIIEIQFDKDHENMQNTLLIHDNGKGIGNDELEKVADPFFTSRTTRKVGLGIPLAKLNAERTGGSFEIHSTPGKGTALKACFKSDHLDCIPDGDIPGTLILLASANPEIEFIFTFNTNAGSYQFNTIEVKNILDGLAFIEPGIYESLKEMIAVNMEELDSASDLYETKIHTRK